MPVLHQNYGLSQNCLRAERRTLGMVFFSTFLLSLSCFLMSFFPFLLFLFPRLPSPFFSLFSRSPFCPFSSVLHSVMLSSGQYTISVPLSLSPVPHSCPPPSFPFSIHSITTGTRVHFVIFVIFIKIKYFPF